jgi:hypothetical protein
MPVRLIACWPPTPTRKKSMKPSQTETAPSRAHQQENGTRCQKDMYPTQGIRLDVSERSPFSERCWELGRQD